jgi:uncharacterized membrane protein
MSQVDEVPSSATIRIVLRWIMAVFYVAAGVIHLAAPERFLPIVPDFVPKPYAVVLVTGLCEIAGSVALLTRRLRRLAGVMLAIYAVCVFPANIKHAIDSIHVPPLPDSCWYHGPRLMMQPVLVWWALFCAGVIDCPAGNVARRSSNRRRKGLHSKPRPYVRLTPRRGPSHDMTRFEG